MAIGHAVAVLGWLEQPEKDRPPQEIWLDDEALEAHFNAVASRYSEGRGSEPVPQFDQNELTRGLRD